MAKCKCGTRPRIVSSVIQSMNDMNQVSDTNCGCCRDVCSNPICGDPSKLSLMAPLIYDEIGINLCATAPIGAEIATTYPTVTNATIKAINATYTYGTGDVTVEAITGRQNCYLVTLSNITVQFAMNLYDAACRLVATIYPEIVYLPPTTTDPTYDEDTNPTSVELEIFAPYGLSYTTTTTPPITTTPVINYIGYVTGRNTVTQGINLSSMAKLLDFSIADDTITVGLTLVLSSIYFVGYRVESAGKIDTPKGSIVSPENSDCMRFVAGDLLNLTIKPLDLGAVSSQNCNCNNNCTKNCNCGATYAGKCDNTTNDSTTCNSCNSGNCLKDNCGQGAVSGESTVVIPGI